MLPARKRIKTEDGEHAKRFDQTEYKKLKAHYYDEILVKNVELPGGRTLRSIRPTRSTLTGVVAKPTAKIR